MAEYAVLKNAPIIEALIDIRIRMKDDLRVEHFDTLANSISTEYPEKKKRHRWEGKLEFKKGEQPFSDIAETVDGYIFHLPTKSKFSRQDWMGLPSAGLNLMRHGTDFVMKRRGYGRNIPR